MATANNAEESDSDKYLPLPKPSPKLNNKCFQSASKIVSQQHKKSCSKDPEHDEPKQEVLEQSVPDTTQDLSNDDNKSASKGKLNITTLGLPK